MDDFPGHDRRLAEEGDDYELWLIKSLGTGGPAMTDPRLSALPLAVRAAIARAEGRS